MMYNNIFNSIKTKGPSSDQAVALGMFLSSLKCEMSCTSQRGLCSVTWIPILDPNYRYQPTKTISPVSIDREHTPGLSVCLNSLFVCDPACLSGTGHAKNIPDPTSCQDAYHILSVTVPSCRGFHNRLSIFMPLFP